MAAAEQVAGRLNLALVRGDDFGQLLDLSIDLTGYTFEASIYSTLTGEEFLAPSVTEVDLSYGQVNLSMTSEETAALPVGTLGFRITWTAPGGAVRRFLEGVCEVNR